MTYVFFFYIHLLPYEIMMRTKSDKYSSFLPHGDQLVNKNVTAILPPIRNKSIFVILCDIG